MLRYIKIAILINNLLFFVAFLCRLPIFLVKKAVQERIFFDFCAYQCFFFSIQFFQKRTITFHNSPFSVNHNQLRIEGINDCVQVFFINRQLQSFFTDFLSHRHVPNADQKHGSRNREGKIQRDIISRTLLNNRRRYAEPFFLCLHQYIFLF